MARLLYLRITASCICTRHLPELPEMAKSRAEKGKLLIKAFWSLVVAVFVAIVTVSLIRMISAPISKLVVLGVASLVAMLVCRHRLQIPRTKIRVLAKDIFALWGVLWLGIGGAVVLAIVASAVASYSSRHAKKRALLQIISDAIATFIVASAYYFASNYFLNNNGTVESIEATNAVNIVATIFSMAAIHFVVNSSVIYFGRRINGEAEVGQLLKETLLFPVGSYLLTIGATLLINLTFLQFGIEFGLVVLPITVIGSIAYMVHQQRLAKKTREIMEASRIHLATVEALATAIDARDQMGIGHVRRTQIFAVGIGEFLGLSNDEINALRTAALLHDIGKLAVPDHILNKPGTLTQAEIEKTKIHSSVGASILEKVGFNTPVVPTVKYHHENWDGTGYPEALKGENIPLTARILAVADAYDTLRGARPYRPPVSRSEACAILEKDAGRKFDPRLVRIFLDNLSRLEAEAARQGLGYDLSRGDDRLRRIADGGAQQSFVDQIKLANREAFTLYELAKEFSSSLNLTETANLFAEKIRELVHFDTCSIYLLDEKRGAARSIHVAGKHAAVFHNHEIKPGDGVTGRVLEMQSIARNCDPWPDLKLLRASITSDYRSMVSLPLLTDGKLIGAVSLYSTNRAGYSDEHLRLLETISRIASDAISKSKQHAEAETYALTDPMTGLPNARSLKIQFEREVARARRSKSAFQVLMLDLDGFKQVNDSFGHKVGDRMLIEIGRAIKAQLREYDFLARYAGDEFVAIIPDTSDAAVRELCTRIEKAVKGLSLEIGEHISRVGVSIGSATYPQSGEAFDSLLVSADKAMYSAKAKRKKTDNLVKMIPRPSAPLEFDIPIDIHPDDVETVVDIDETHIYSPPKSEPGFQIDLKS
jgi:diguanylate cyclase (GGDEF)-like protein/putative nucleotidyltransferase with HDIG domain